MDGILLIDKPQGWTSHDVVAKVRSVLRQAQRDGLAGQQGQAVRKIRVGHSGTLDPMATGLLILLIGKATKQQDTFMKLDKSYEAEITLGATSDTDDAEGEIQKTDTGARVPTNQELEDVLKEFTGEIEQVPPAYSAVKTGGQRAYKEARAGKTVKLEPRSVTVHDLNLLEYHYPVLRLVATVSSGTYIRSLARDIGASLGTGGYVSALRRTRIGAWSLANSVQMDGLDIARVQKSIVPVQ